MMRWIIGSSLKGRFIVTAAAALLIIFGFTQLTKMPVDALPEFARPYVEIQTEALGLSAHEVEAMITTPMEADMINGTPWAEEIRSVSIPGMSSIVLTFERDTDIMRARQVVHERMTELFTLPQVSKTPTMVNPVSSTARVVEIGMSSDELSLIDLSVLARWTIAPQLMGLPGVANVSIWGERQRQLQVQVDPAKLHAENVSLMQVVKTAGNSLWSSPLSYLEASTPGTGGWIDTPNQRLGVRHILPIDTAEDLASIPIEGAPSKRLGDVATLVEDHQPLIGDALIDDAPSLILVIEKFPWASTRAVTTEVENELANLRHGLPGVSLDATLFRPATFLETAMDNLTMSFLISGVLILVVLFGFYFNWLTTLVSVVTILVAAVVAGGVFYLRGIEINMIVLAGFLIAMMVFVDDAIVGVDHIVRRIRKSREEGHGESTAYLIREAVIESRRPLIYALVAMLLSVAPLVFLQGVSGAFWRPLALTYMLAIGASFLAAIIVTPALCLLLLKDGSSLSTDSPVAGLLSRVYSGISGGLMQAPRTAFVAVCVITVLGLLAAVFVSQESLVPDFKETDLVVSLETQPGASHPAMSRVVTRTGAELRNVDGVRNVSAQFGRAILSDKHTDINAGELRISIDPTADYEATVASVKNVVSGFPDSLSAEVLTYRQQQLRKELTGTGESLVVRVYGENTDTIIEKAEEVQQMLAGIDGISDPQVQYPEKMPTLEIEVDVERAREYGLKPGDVRRSAASLVSGIVVGQLFEEQKVFDVVVWGTPEIRSSVDDIRNLPIDLPDGSGQVALQTVADVRIVASDASIHRDAVARRVDVTAQVSGRDYASVADDIDDGIDGIAFPLEYRAELLGVYAESLAARDRVIAFVLASLVLIFLLLQAFSGSWSLATALFLTLPAALAGGAAAVWLTSGGNVSMGSLIGFLAIFGLSIRHATTIIGRIKDFERKEGSFSEALVRKAVQERAVPILISSLGLLLAFLPFAFGGVVAGLEIAQPLAVVVVGGLITSIFYVLVGVPAIYLLFGKTKSEPQLQLGEELVSGITV